MAWDFSTEPEFEEKLEWMRGFVRDEIIPLETLDLDAAAFARATRPLKDEVRARGLWAAHLPPELGGGGFGQVRLGLMHEILGQCGYAPAIFGNVAGDNASVSRAIGQVLPQLVIAARTRSRDSCRAASGKPTRCTPGNPEVMSASISTISPSNPRTATENARPSAISRLPAHG